MYNGTLHSVDKLMYDHIIVLTLLSKPNTSARRIQDCWNEKCFPCSINALTQPASTNCNSRKVIFTTHVCINFSLWETK